METVEEKYPEHVKLRAVKEQSQTVGTFLDWLSNTKSIELAVRHEHTDSCYADVDSVERAMKLSPRRLCGYMDRDLVPTHLSIRQLLAEFFEIDEEKIEAEKCSMLDEMRGGKEEGAVNER